MTLLVGTVGFQIGYALAAIMLLVPSIAATALTRSGPAGEGIGKGRFGIERTLRPTLLTQLPPPLRNQPPPPVDMALLAAEGRQMLEAKSYLRGQRGESPIDVDAELARLLDSARDNMPDLDEKLHAEVRTLVVARNERRMRSGQDPLDVDAEVERQLSDFVGSR